MVLLLWEAAQQLLRMLNMELSHGHTILLQGVKLRGMKP